MPGKIAVLDDYLKSSRPLFAALEAAGYEVTIFTNTLLPYNHPGTSQGAKDSLVRRLQPFDIICTMRERTQFPAELVARLPNLKLLLTTGTRNASIDVKACLARGIPVAGTTAEKRDPDNTTQQCVALILGLARNVGHDDAVMKAGGWQTAPAISLSGKTFGAVGMGRLGVSVSKIMKLAFNMKIVTWSSNLTQEAADEKAKAAGFPVEDANGEKTFKVVSREELFRTSDVVSIHVVLSERSRGMFTMNDLKMMKKSALFVNTSRGPIVNEDDLLEAGKQGIIRGIALDVYGLEPLPLNSQWRTTNWGVVGRSYVLLSPHMGYVEEETIGDWYKQQVENIGRWEKGEDLIVPFKDTGY